MAIIWMIIFQFQSQQLCYDSHHHTLFDSIYFELWVFLCIFSSIVQIFEVKDILLPVPSVLSKTLSYGYPKVNYLVIVIKSWIWIWFGIQNTFLINQKISWTWQMARVQFSQQPKLNRNLSSMVKIAIKYKSSNWSTFWKTNFLAIFVKWTQSQKRII